ncbi:acyltransferase domain-containing protein [Actinocorallia sp. API 0066]|uniref:type I polyketide synthase n=1 Tax=Actinocorallia sp. API 0066 TaxID=2896846 RepID=UPI001E371146|nr:type I polyketide synthase [Actinocorallia sp. API 0066]MCD0450494.1 acyltransferase domain-containing protein [Actinocorallia sp. API 0066]
MSEHEKFSPHQARTLVEVLRHRASRTPDRIGYRFLSYDGSGRTEVTPLTYGRLDAWARAAAVTLLDEAEPGDRVLMLCPPGLDYLAYFFGCLYAGLIPVPAYPPTSARHIGRVEAVARDSAAKVVLVGGVADLTGLPESFETPDGPPSAVAAATWILVGDDVLDGREERWSPPSTGPDDTAFLQYTSGSTADPKGVMVTHGNLIANARSGEAGFELGPESVGVSWLPPYHDMGLIGGIIFPLYTGFPMNLMSPTSFIREPVRWLDAITRFRATVSPGPNFAYQMCVDRVDEETRDRLDLSSWTHALNGAEPVRADVLDRFADAFARTGFKRSGFYPCYGMAESTLVVSGGRAGGDPAVRLVSKPDLETGIVLPPRDVASAQALAGSGRIVPDMDVRIVDPASGEPAEPNRVGEIWLRGPSIAVGYFDAPEATEEAFGARLADGSGPFLRTGDLGLMLDGELFVTGRASDLMIFRGRNVYPQDVEATACDAHPALTATRAAAFSVEHDGAEALVIVQELPRGGASEAAMERFAKAVRRRVSEAHQLQVHEIVFIGARKIPVTSSGKIQRKPCKARYLAGDLPRASATPGADWEDDPGPDDGGGGGGGTPAPPPPSSSPGAAAPASRVEAKVTELVAKYAGVGPERVDAGEPFTAYGLDSVHAVALAADLSDWLGREVPATFAWDHPTLAEAARALAAPDVPDVLEAAPAGRPEPAGRTGPVEAAGPDDGVAVVGVGCRLPGGVVDADSFWDLLVSGRSGIGEVPADRWDLGEFFDPDPDAPGRMYARHGGFLPDVRGFDAGLFGIPPREAVGMDPQHRLVLEVVWEALEHAGIAPDSLRGSRTGMFVGMGGSDYERLGLRGGVPIDGYAATGSAVNFAANRVSYALGLEGPSLVVDTACSSSLVALHLAVQALRSGECDLAVVAGVNLLLAPDTYVALSKGRMLSPTGECHTFDASADGYVRGEGCGAVVLRRAADARDLDGDVLAVVRGTAVNQDGRSNGLTAPSGTAQRNVIRRALSVAGVAPGEVGYVEAHGTGTPLGDPIEVRALASVLGEGRERPLALGSVKTNIGHLEAAAGIAGLIKAILVAREGRIPPHLNLSAPSPHIAWADLPVHVPTELTDWPDERRVVGVSSFGFGGTNAHAVLENAPPTRPEPVSEAAPEPVVVKLAAADDAALRAAAARLADHAATLTPADLPALAHAAGVGRADLAERAAVVADSPDELVDGLRDLTEGRVRRGLARGRRPPGPARKVAFVVPGHGARVAGLFAGLYGEVPAVTETLDALAEVLGPVTAPPLAALLDPAAADSLAATETAQPALYAAAVVLGAWWRSLGVEPDLVVGHSLGGYAAAALAGVFSLQDGARLVAARGKAMAGLPAGGAMAALSCAPADLAGLPSVASGEVVVAAENGPRETTVAGPVEAVAALVAEFAARGVRGTRLDVPLAFHSAQMDAALPALERAVSEIALHAPSTRLISDHTGELADERITTPGYWTRHTREPVRFGKAVATLRAQGADIVVELGRGGLLPLVAAATDRPPLCVPSARSGETRRALLESLARIWADGAALDWHRATPRTGRVPRLPAYPFQHTAYWPAELTTATPSPVTTTPAPAAPALVTATRAPVGGTPAVGRAEIEALLRVALADLLGLRDPADLPGETGLFDLGLTSAMVVELRGRLERDLGREIPTTAVFDHPTVARLAANLAHDNAATAAARVPAAALVPAVGGTPLAIVGMACRFPGGADDLDAFWRLLSEGRDGTGPVPPERWTPTGDHDARGGFLTGPVADFDAAAFGISPREARAMDPQQRLLLEVAREALDDAGTLPGAVEGTRTAVYVGINTSDYMQLLAADPDADLDAHVATGNTFSVAAGRLSYLLGAQGPSLAVDTACSSSLVAAHLAARSLRSGESDVAIVGGVNLMLSQTTTGSLAKMRALSPDGRCKTFDADADGYARGEGCGVVVLKRLADAEADGDRIWAVLRGSAVNQDGASAGLTVPNGVAQQRVIREALADAGVAPAQLGYVEAHGTGTPLGDPLEIQALAEVLDGADPVWVGSAKTNVGHLEAAAGVCGLIKVALMLHHGMVPPHLNLREPNPYVRWDEVPVRVPAELTEWPQDRPRIAGLSSFGFSGTNAHLVLAEAPASPARDEPAPRPELLLLSASGEQELAAAASAHAEALRRTGAVWPDLTRTAALEREHLPFRAAVVASGVEEAAAKLEAAAAGARKDGLRRDRAKTRVRTVVVYSGQGCQWTGMGRALWSDPVAGPVLAHCDARVRELAGWSLHEQLTADDARLDDTVFAQPAIFAVQAALTALWRSWGLRPDAVLGHSVGEIGAAYAAEVFDLDRALEIVVRRGEVMGSTRGQGAMAVLGLPAEEVAELLPAFAGRLHVAAVNSPAHTVVGGEAAALAELEQQARARGALWTALNGDYAFHTPLMLPVRNDLMTALHGFVPDPPCLPVFSTVTGEAAHSRSFDSAYWADNMVRTVRFRDALTAAAGSGHTVVLEIGPHAVLGGAAAATLAGREEGATVVGSMRNGRDPRTTLLDAAGALHAAGVPLDHAAIQPGEARRAWLPPRRWRRERFWLPALPSLRTGREGTGDDAATEQAHAHSYEIQWQPAPAPRGTAAADGTWLLLADEGGLAVRVAAALESAGHRAAVVSGTPGATGPDALLAPVTAALAETPRIAGIVHLGALDAAPDVRTPGPELDAALARACGPLTFLPRLLAERPAPLWLVTRGATGLGPGPAALAQAPAWGLGRVFALEQPESWGGMLDLDPDGADPARDAAAVTAELLGPDGEDQIAYRAGERRVARLTRAAEPARPGAAIDPDGAYLVTGGRGALGLRVAERLAARGARHLVLLGRRPVPDPEAAGPSDAPLLAALARLREQGVTVHTPSADVADARAMAAVLGAGGWPALRGVVHAAGISVPCALTDLTWDGLRGVLLPKVEGSLVLDALADPKTLDFFTMFSSASSVWGSALAGSYVAANFFQDVLAHDQARRDVPGLAVNWGWWSDSDMAAQHADYFEAMGLHVLPDDVGLAALDRLLGSGTAQRTVAPVDWARFRAVLEAKRRRPLLELLGDDGGQDTAAVDRAFLARLDGAPTATARRRVLEDLLQTHVGAVLGAADGATLDRELGFFSAGFDSIMSVELRARLQTALGAKLPATLAFEHPTIAALAAFLLAEVLDPGTPDPAPAAAPSDDLSLELEQLSEEELVRLLEDELAQEDRYEHG